MQSNKHVDAILAIIDQGLSEDEPFDADVVPEPEFQWPGWRHQRTALFNTLQAIRPDLYHVGWTEIPRRRKRGKEALGD